MYDLTKIEKVWLILLIQDHIQKLEKSIKECNQFEMLKVFVGTEKYELRVYETIINKLSADPLIVDIETVIK